ncbi:MAG: transposase [Methylocystaceae bacterium]|nr:MAG: transposase [Methylocystaceae bacterium]
MIGVLVNQVIENLATGTVERVLWIADRDRGLYAIDIRSPIALPVFYSDEEFEKLEAEKLLRRDVDDPWSAPFKEDTLLLGHRRRRDKAWELIRPLALDQPAIFQERARGRAINSYIEASGSNKQTLYRLLRRYWQRGLSPNALLPDYDRCGGRGKEKAANGKKRGRVPTSDNHGLNVTPGMREIFRAVATRCFAANRKQDFAGAYHEMVASYYSDRVIDERTGRQILVTRDEEVPSLRQFRYWFSKENDIFQILRTRRTPRVYDKDMRALTSSSTAETIGPGSRYQIDATIADVYLVSRCDRSKIVGRPVLYVVVDVFSRMVAGIYVGFEGPSWVGAMMALSNAASPKMEFCHRFGIEIGEADWPCRHLPDALLGDRGEMIGGAVETLANSFHVRIENSAPYRADWKGIVEQRFRLLPAKFKPYVPGYVEDDFRARGSRDYRLDAVLDIDEFTRIVLYCVLYYNNEHELRVYDKSPEMAADRVAAIPIELWDWGIARRSGKLRAYPSDLVRLSLLPSDEATVTANGIHYAGSFYSCSKAIEEHWFERARQGGAWKIRISYEPRCMDEIYVHDESGRARFISCSLTDRSRHHGARTLWEIDQMRQEERRDRLNRQPQTRQARVNLADSIKNVVETAHAKRAEPDGRPSSERTRNIRENRRVERRDRQEQEAYRPARPKEEAQPKIVRFPGAEPEDDYSLPNIGEILRNLKKEGKDDDGR